LGQSAVEEAELACYDLPAHELKIEVKDGKGRWVEVREADLQS
jgi:hypothetical protein